ncbi:MAG: 2,3-bisphosphoglycerate-independent phosphoglycerate mutase [Bdellovibrionota bacterium]
MSTVKRKLLTVVMDGIGVREEMYGNAVKLAHTSNLDWLKQNGLYTAIKAHGTYVGLPSDNDIGNSEVGHNALGAGVIYDQGAKLVNNAIKDGSIFKSAIWQEAVTRIKSSHGSTLHFIGLLSDGNVHSHQDHLLALLKQAHKEGINKIRIHVLLDGRDVAPRSAEIYAEALEKVLLNLRNLGCDAKVASGGGRMVITMDRYEADWQMVYRGWQVHVLGKGLSFPNLESAISEFRKDSELTDQYFPGFVITEEGKAIGTIEDNDVVLLTNFRGDRAIEISKAFCQEEFSYFDRERFPRVYFAGMMEYDGDEHIPANYLVSPPKFDGTMGEYLAAMGVHQFAASETQKYGHVTFFWNGNRSGMFDPESEKYLEIPSDNLSFNLKPWMKAYEIVEATVKELCSDKFEFGRINFPNGDMVGHTGDLEATIVAVATVDLMIGRLIRAANDTDTILVITADHGNAEQMLEGEEEKFPNWLSIDSKDRPKARTSHTLSEVPFYIYDPKQRHKENVKLRKSGEGSLANFANTALELMGLETSDRFYPSLLIQKP